MTLSRRPGWFSGAEALLESYVSTITHVLKIEASLRVTEPSRSYPKLMRLHRQSAALLATLATRLRLTPSSKLDKRTPTDGEIAGDVIAMPRVLNIKRDVPNFKPGWNFKRDGRPPGAVYIGHKIWRLPESKWGNPFMFGKHGNREEVIDHFKRWLYATPGERAEIIAKFKLARSLYGVSVGPLINDVHELRGFDLVCWCAPPCHGDVLLRLANA